MTRAQFIRASTAALASRYGQREAEAIARLVGESLCGFTPLQAVVEPFAPVEREAEATIAVERVASGEPVQYVLGGAWFRDMEFEVTPDTLIPRPETGELVDWILSRHGRPAAPRVVDIGTGSGAIAVSLAVEMPRARVTAVDVSRRALAVAARNATKHGAKVQFVETDILSSSARAAFGAGKFDIAVSNPPYIPAREMACMAPHVVDHEPHRALFVPDDDPLLFYRAIARADLLVDGGELYFEVHEDHATAVCEMLADMGFANLELRRDINDKPRMVGCVKP